MLTWYSRVVTGILLLMKVISILKDTLYVALTLYATLLIINAIYVLIGELPVEDIFKL